MSVDAHKQMLNQTVAGYKCELCADSVVGLLPSTLGRGY